MAQYVMALDPDEIPDVMTEEEWQARITTLRSQKEILTRESRRHSEPLLSFVSETIPVETPQNQGYTNTSSSSSLVSSGNCQTVNDHDELNAGHHISARVLSTERTTATSFCTDRNSFQLSPRIPIISDNGTQLDNHNYNQQNGVNSCPQEISTIVVSNPNVSTPTNPLASAINQSHKCRDSSQFPNMSVRHIPTLNLTPYQILESQLNDYVQNCPSNCIVLPDEQQNDDDNDEVQFLCEAPRSYFHPPLSVIPNTSKFTDERHEEEEKDNLTGQCEMATENDKFNSSQQYGDLIPGGEEIQQTNEQNKLAKQVSAVQTELTLSSPFISPLKTNETNNSPICNKNNSELVDDNVYTEDEYQSTDDSNSGESDSWNDDDDSFEEFLFANSRSSHSSSSRSRANVVSAKVIPCPACNNNWPLVPRLESDGKASIYCDKACLKKHVNSVVRYMKNMTQTWNQRHSNVQDEIDEKQLKFCVINRENDQLGQKHIRESALLKFIIENQTFSIFKPDSRDYFDELEMMHKLRSQHFQRSTHELANSSKKASNYHCKKRPTFDKPLLIKTKRISKCHSTSTSKLKHKKLNDSKIRKSNSHLADKPSKSKYKRVSVDYSSSNENDDFSGESSPQLSQIIAEKNKRLKASPQGKSSNYKDNISDMTRKVEKKKKIEVTQKEPVLWKTSSLCDESQVDSSLTSVLGGEQQNAKQMTSIGSSPKHRIKFCLNELTSTTSLMPLDTLLPREDSSNCRDSPLTQNELSRNKQTAISDKPTESMPNASLLGEPFHGLSIWTGKIDFAVKGQRTHFFVDVYLISGKFDEQFFKDSQIKDNQLTVINRCKREDVLQYLTELKDNKTGRDFSVIRFVPISSDYSRKYNLVYDWLHEAERCGVVETSKAFVRNFYLMPLPSGAMVPKELNLSTVDFTEKNRPNLLVGILIYNSPCLNLERSRHSKSAHTQATQLESNQKLLQQKHSFRDSLDPRTVLPFSPTWWAMQNTRTRLVTKTNSPLRDEGKAFEMDLANNANNGAGDKTDKDKDKCEKQHYVASN